MTEIKEVRELGLIDEIEALKEYNVPEPVIHRIIDKIMRCAEDEKRRNCYFDDIINNLRDIDRNNKAVINALGCYLRYQDKSGEV